MLSLLLAYSLFVPPMQAQDQVLISIDADHPREVWSDGFVLKADQDVHIDAVGPAARSQRYGMSNAWILNALTREVVWEFDAAETHERDRRVREVSDTITLPAGPYEVYYASFPPYHDDDRWDDIDHPGEFVRALIDGLFHGDWRDWDDVYDRSETRDFGVTVRATQNGYREPDLRRLADAFRKEAFLSMMGQEDNSYVQQGFALTQPTEIDIYALGELRRDGAYDHGWIIDADTREPVWTMDYHNTEHAGGAEKNRVANEIIRLPEGRYAAFFATDGSHSFEDWNAAPPYDPAFWGLTLLTVDPSAQQHIELFDYETAPLSDAIIALTGVRDDEHRSEGFTLKQPMDVRIYALGEGRSGRMYDYGWIIDADTRERVWTMDYHDTEHAGGGAKNRLVDDVIYLPAGNYIAHYTTDGSHSAGDWNTAPPYDQQAWGLTLLPADSDYDADAITLYDETADPNVLAQLVHMRDDEHERASFSLSEDGHVHVYALGEGRDGRMYDYAWIESDDTGQVVWEMTYRMTDHAGGAHKNRVVNANIALRAGNYTLHYKTDGSHAFGDWNSSSPDDPTYWGATLRKAD